MNWSWIERASFAMARYFILPLLQFLLALASATAVGLRVMWHAYGMQAAAPCLNDGPSPTSMQSGNTPQAALTTHYNKNFIENLKARTVHLRLCTRFPMPAHAGQIFRNFMIQPLGANTTQAPEGTVGAGIAVTINYQDYQLGQWADYLNISDKAFITSISDDLMNYEREMAYRLALTIDDLVMVYFDYLRTLDPKTANGDVLTTPWHFTHQQLMQVPFSLEGQNVLPMDRGYYCGKIHPFFIGDVLGVDNTNNSVVDILKHTPEGLLKLEELPNGPDGDEVNYFDLAGCRWLRSTNCTQSTTSPVAVAAAATSIRTYLAGKDAMVAIKLDRPDRTQIDDGKYRNMTIWRGEYRPGNVADPAGVIGAGTSYNAILAFGVPPDITSRARCFDAIPITT
jgi:hypothetical protein